MMPRYACPICGDPDAYPLWASIEPPAGCPHDASVNGVAECGYQRAKAEQAARWRKVRPDCFDENGNIKPDGLAKILNDPVAQPPDKRLIFG